MNRMKRIELEGFHEAMKINVQAKFGGVNNTPYRAIQIPLPRNLFAFCFFAFSLL